MGSPVTANEGRPLWAEKDKDAALDYTFDLSRLLPAGAALDGVTWSVTPAGAVSVDSSSFDGQKARVVLSGGAAATWYAVNCHWTSGSLHDQVTMRLFIREDHEAVPSLGSVLFPNRFSATDQLRRNQLLQAVGSSVSMDDDYLWSKMVAAEVQVQHTLRVPLQPTKFFPSEPTADEIAALGSTPWALDPGYEYDPEFFYSDRWGHIRLRNKPLQSVEKVIIRFPGAPATTYYSVPREWFRMDRKYGDLQFIPTAGSQDGSIPLNVFMIQVLAMGRRVPFAIEVTYTAGLVAAQFPELVDVVKKMAVLSVLEDRFMPTSGSISADGLSQSISQDMEKHRDTIDAILTGGKGSNGGLMAAIHGIKVGAF